MAGIRKVLMLAHPEMDHLAYMMFDGLCKVLGAQNIFVYPFVNHYAGGVDKDYILDDGKLGYTAPPGYASSHENPMLPFDELAGMMDEFDIVYLSSARTYAVKAFKQFKKRFGNNMPPLVFSEGEDYQSLCTIEMIKRAFNTAVCFKRELLQGDLDTRKDLHPLYPLPFSAITDNLAPDNPDKDIDVFALFGNTYPIREDIVKLINSSVLLKKYKIHVGIDHFSNEPEKVVWQDPNRFNMPPLLQYKPYHEIMARSKINILARGWGCDTLRRFEAPCYSGLVMSDNIPILTPYPFKDGEHIVYFKNSLAGLVPIIDEFLKSDQDRIRIGKAGREHCMKYHTTEARAKYFLEKIEENI